MAESKYPTEIIDLPSKGWYYPEKSPMSSGKVELKYMTASEEDLLTSRNLISKGVVLDKLMEALIVDPIAVKYNDLLVGDKHALMVAARILGYGKNYEATVTCPQCSAQSQHDIDLQELHDKNIEFKPEDKGKNEFVFKLPVSGKTITFKLLTHKDVKDAEKELDAMLKLTKNGNTKEITTRMAYSILSVDGITEKKELREFIAAMPARDAMAWREYAKEINPEIDLTFSFECPKCGYSQDRMEVPIDVNFFWPDARV